MASIFNTSDFAVLHAEDSVAQASRLLVERRVAALPVIDGAGKLAGVFSMDRLLAMLLPKAATLEAGVTDLAFVSDTLDNLREKMREISTQAVGAFVEREAPVVHPDTPLLEIALLLYRGENDLPLVERGSGKLLGVVSAADLLRAVSEAEAR